MTSTTRSAVSSPPGPFASQLRANGPEAKITAGEIRDLTAEKLKLDGFNHLLGLIDDRLAQLASLDAPPTIVFITLPATVVKRYRTVHQTKQGAETVWNLRAGIKARAMQRGLRTQLLQQEPSSPTLMSTLPSWTIRQTWHGTCSSPPTSRPADSPGRPWACRKALATSA
jgi:hypothetical protein